MDEVLNVTSTNRGFRTKQHVVATYEQTKEGLSHFYPKKMLSMMGLTLVPLICNYRQCNFFSKLVGEKE